MFAVQAYCSGIGFPKVGGKKMQPLKALSQALAPSAPVAPDGLDSDSASDRTPTRAQRRRTARAQAKKKEQDYAKKLQKKEKAKKLVPKRRKKSRNRKL